MAGWYRAEADWWPAIIDALPRPLGREAALSDLRWHANEVAAGRSASLPGRRTLAARWGWSERMTRSLVEDSAAWADPYNVPPMSHQCPTNVPPMSHLTTVEPVKVLENVPPMSHLCPTNVPLVSQGIEIVSDITTVSAANKEQETKNKKQNIHIVELNEKWLSLFGKLRAPTKEGIEKTAKAIGKEKASLLIDWLASNHPRARLLRGETGEENRLHSATPWRPSHRTEYLSFAEDEAESPTPKSKSGPANAPPTNKPDLALEICDQIQKTPHPDDKRFIDVAIQIPHIEMLADGFGGVSFLRSALLDKWKRKETIERVRRMLSNVE